MKIKIFFFLQTYLFTVFSDISFHCLFRTLFCKHIFSLSFQTYLFIVFSDISFHCLFIVFSEHFRFCVQTITEKRGRHSYRQRMRKSRLCIRKLFRGQRYVYSVRRNGGQNSLNFKNSEQYEGKVSSG